MVTSIASAMQQQRQENSKSSSNMEESYAFASTGKLKTQNDATDNANNNNTDAVWKQ